MKSIRNTAVAIAVTLCVSTVVGQGGGGFQGGRGRTRRTGRAGGPPPANLPEAPTAVTLPTLSAEITGPGPMFDSSPSLCARKGPGGIRLPDARVLRLGHGQRRALHDAHRRPEAGRQREVQRSRAGRGDARQRRRAHVRVHVDLHDVVRSRGRRDPDHAAGAVRGAQRGPLQGPEAQRRADQRDPRAGRIARPRRHAARWSGPKDGARRHVDDRRRADQLPAGAHGLPDAADAAHLRRLPADVERRAGPRRGRAGDPRADDARGEPGTSPTSRTATRRASSTGYTSSPAWGTSTRATACG